MNSSQNSGEITVARGDSGSAGAWWVLNEAHEALRVAVVGVSASDWERPTPCADWDVTQVLQHASGDQLAWAWSITGDRRDADDPFAPSGRLSEAPKTLLESAFAESAAAFAAVPADRQDTPTPLPQGPMPAAVAAGACALDAAIHAWDIAVATGQPSPLSNALARELLPVATSIVEPLRAYGVYAAIVPAEQGDEDSDTLLRYLDRTGRHDARMKEKPRRTTGSITLPLVVRTEPQFTPQRAGAPPAPAARSRWWQWAHRA